MHHIRDLKCVLYGPGLGSRPPQSTHRRKHISSARKPNCSRWVRNADKEHILICFLVTIRVLLAVTSPLAVSI
ncbi:unnamed protein product [Brassica rapa]|uniref:Uncharacterized protein n=1 Tax=Brassica campestris TaxID=3711 RepID=A0A3P6A4I2_BRACM|nr:unnamed protein product [Brassica rapa]VDC88376.1 unnamed protein product [Brassica rapa]